MPSAIQPALPTYASPETTAFHPVFEWALQEALALRHLSTAYTIKHHYPIGAGIVDFVLIENSSGKVVFPIEIKRTQSDVRGQGRRQARDYWNNLGAACQTPFYCASNLELTELFRNDSTRPRTSAQIIHLTKPVAGTLSGTTVAHFYSALTGCLTEILDIVLGRSSFVYFTGLSQFQSNIELVARHRELWHKAFIPACYEYIRGAATNVPHLRTMVSSWKAASAYAGTPGRLLQLGSAVDFSNIFIAPAPSPGDPSAFSPSVLVEAFESGKNLGNGDDIAELVNEILKPRGPGIVETDVELAQLLGVVAKVALNGDLRNEDEVFDPGSGSGRLLTSLLAVAFPSLSPRQVRANELEPLFAESLSLRLGLAFAHSISPINAPVASIGGIESVNPSDLTNVRLVVMNPPFLSGVQAAGIKGKFANRIREVSGADSFLHDGQIALEALFLELVWNLVRPGTVIATVFPIQHLHRSSSEVVKLRQFLASRFGLSHIVFYPGTGVFESVTKQTVILVGTKDRYDDNVSLVEIQKPVSDVDLSQLMANLQSGMPSPTHGVAVQVISRATLLTSAADGWKSVIGAGKRAAAFIQATMTGYHLLGNLPRSQVRRGTLGNKGNTQLTVFDLARPRFPSVLNLIPPTWIRKVLNSTESMPRELTLANAPESSILPPLSAFVSGTTENQTLLAITTEYVARVPAPTGSQAGRTKGVDEIVRDLKADQKDFGAGWVLVQRASRTKGQVAIQEVSGVLLSTNVHMVHLPTLVERKLLASWLLSLFGQLQMELYSVPQEGMRKLELGGVKKIVYPDFSSIPGSVVAQLLSAFTSEPALDFAAITLRPSDHLWASVVDPANPTGLIANALAIFQDLVDERRGC